MGDMGLAGMGGAAGAGDALQTIFQQRMQAANAQRQQEALEQQDALTRLKIQEHADEIRQRVEGQKQAERDRAHAAKAANDARFNAQANQIPTDVPLPGQNPIVQGVPGRFNPTPISAPAPPPGIAAPDQPPTDQPMPGTVANTPAPAERTFTRIPTPQEQDAQKVDQQEMAMLNDPNTPPQMKQFLQLRRILPKGESVPAQAFTPPKEAKDPTPHFSPLPQFDEKGNPTAPMAFDALTGTARAIPGVGANKAAPGAAQAAQHEASKKEALGSLDQLDQAIEAARNFIGPGAGRVSSLQQMVGSQDPAIQALGTKMLLAKMQVDHAASGTVRAGASPQLLARWDNILGQKVTPEGLKAAVQAMREILGGGASGGGGGVPAVGSTFQGGKVLSVEKVP